MLLFVDGFDSYPTADLLKKWSANRSDVLGTYPTISSSGRYGTGTGAVQMGTYGVAGLIKNIPSNPLGIIVGFALKTSTSTLGNLLTFTNNKNITQGYLTLINGNLSYTNGQRSSYTGISTVSITTGIWNYIEFKYYPKSSALANETQVRLNGAVVIDVPAGTNTIGDNGYNAQGITVLSLACGYANNTNNVSSPGTVALYDDFYLCDNTGTTNNDFLGDVRIETIFPSGVGDSTQFTPSAGSNWSCVSETPEDGDSTYVTGNAPNLLDLYEVNDLSNNPAKIYGIQINTIGRKVDAGNRVIVPVLKSGGATYDHATTNPFGLADGYTLNLDLWEKDPNGNVDWTGTSVNALQAGLKVVT